MFVGGEFYYDGRWVSDAPSLSTEHSVFLNGGAACLTVISRFLLDHKIHKILLPAYLCPSILTVLERSGLAYDFYQINPDFSIDLADLARKANDHRAVYFINYFGFLNSDSALDFMRSLQRSGVIVVEDNAQAGFHDHPTGDFVFNSLRKFVPFDGGYLSTTHDLSPYLNQEPGRINRRLDVIRKYRGQLADYLLDGKGSHAELEAMFALAEHYYEKDQVVTGDAQERDAIERLDWKGIRQIRRANYEYMLSLISSIPEISPIFPALQADNLPLGLPVYFSGVPRGPVYEELGNSAIGLSIHWDDILEDPRLNHNPLAVDIASKILTLVIDQRTSHKQMDYLVMNLMRAIELAKAAHRPQRR